MHPLLLLFVFSIFSFSYLIINASSLDDKHHGSYNDRVSLLAFKSQITNHPHSVFHNWNESIPICRWQGITCDAKHRRVVSLEFVNKGLVGTLSPFVGNLSCLQVLDLSNNSFQGAIPIQIGKLPNLYTLVLELNSFTGEIPANISGCLKLKNLCLGGNHLTGTMPPNLAILSNMEILTLYRNKLVGRLLDIVVNMTSLQILSAAGNSFEGNIPHNIGLCKNLTFFVIAQNKISGTIPPSFYNLSSLEIIEVHSNKLKGFLPSDIGSRFPLVKNFRIDDNNFHGHVPISMSNLTHLKLLNFDINNFTGKFLVSARNMPNLTQFGISLNYFGMGEEGDLNFLQTLSNCTHLRSLDVHANNLGGILPPTLGNLSTSLVAFSVFDNHIVGTIPFELFNLNNLQALYLHNNQLIGNLPHEIRNLTKLESFFCRYNDLIGSIPSSIGTLPRLSILSMNNNNFEGSIPSSIGNCTNLLYLDLSQNNLTGTLSPHLFQVAQLFNLYLDHNRFHGTIPEEISQMKNLVALDLSENAFIGKVPSSLASCVSLTLLNMGGNQFSGSIPQSFKSLADIQYLNLSRNNLSGQIPNFLVNFSLLELDLSFNNLEGEVPMRGVFVNLSAISLSGNSKLCGGKRELHLPRCPTNNLARRPNKLSHAVIVVISISCLVASISIALFVYLVLFKRKKNNGANRSSMKEPLPKVSYGMLHKATNGFSETNLLGTGHFGSVYKGVLEPDNMVVAVKVMRLGRQEASKSFTVECKAMRNIRHRNLVKIVTACSSTDYERNDFKALVYEFMPNGNLEQWIHSDQNDGQEDQRQSLSLQQRLNIATDVASALDYLHNGCENPVIHCDLKPNNILLDDEMIAHVGDFGISRFRSSAGTTITSSVFAKGTVGYAAPEYGLGSSASKEGDVYSYGIVLIEIMTAIRPTDGKLEGDLNLHKYAKLALTDGLATIIDPRLVGDAVGANHEDQNVIARNGNRMIESIKAIIELGVKCSVESPHDRMSMKDVVKQVQTISNKFSRQPR